MHRGEAVLVQGTVTNATGDCLRARIDFGLRRATEQHALGVVLTDEHGHFSLSTAVPMNIGVGAYDVTATASETSACQRLWPW